MSDIFISYGNQDSDFAESLILHLKNEGISVLERETSPSHEKSYISIERAIRNASVLLTIMTPAAKASEIVRYEWIFALGAGISVITIVCQETELHPRLTTLPNFDFTHPLAQPWDALIEAIEGITKRLEPHRAPAHQNTPLYIRMAITALDSANPEDREGAIENLAQAGHPVAIDALVGALSHPLKDVRTLAALARGNAGDIRAMPELLDALRQKDEEISNEAIIALGNIGDATIAPHLIDILHHRWDRSRYLITDALEKMGSAVVPMLQNILQEEYVERKVWAIQTLKGFGSSAVPSLILALLDKERAVKI
ncbi:MAG: toll/interleukin-1 receptor domain-containing protein, partial [Ktedonobacteraceae bacterium]|nr:toll/interleukin-1 receptor domain-containing protein [Ktedonobacteraceae bacterium]